MARGFGRLFWGIPITLMLFIGLMVIHMHPSIRIPPYLIGSLLNAWGAVALLAAKPSFPSWSRTAKLLAASAFLQIYLAPFALWWRSAPHNLYLTLHVCGVVLATVALLFLCIRLSVKLATGLGLKHFALECRLCSLAVIGLVAGPILYVTLGALEATLAYETSFVLEVREFIRDEVPLWLSAALVATFAISMTTAWKSKEICLHAIAEEDETTGE